MKSLERAVKWPNEGSISQILIGNYSRERILNLTELDPSELFEVDERLRQIDPQLFKRLFLNLLEAFEELHARFDWHTLELRPVLRRVTYPLQRDLREHEGLIEMMIGRCVRHQSELFTNNHTMTVTLSNESYLNGLECVRDFYSLWKV